MAAYTVEQASDDDWSVLYDTIEHHLIQQGFGSRGYVLDTSLRFVTLETSGASGGAFAWVG